MLWKVTHLSNIKFFSDIATSELTRSIHEDPILPMFLEQLLSSDGYT